MSPRVLHYSDVETALDEPDRVGALARTVDRLRDGATVVVGSGDNTAPGALSLATAGGAAIDLFETVAPDADTFGNHDFDFGPARARELAAAAPQPWLCANAERDGGRFAPDATDPGRPVEADGTTVGVVGVAHPETDAINPAAADLTFHDPVPAVRATADDLRSRGAERVVVASHCGRGDERIARETDVDAVLGGHVHDVHCAVVDGTAVVRPGRAARYVSEVDLGGPDVTLHEVTVEDREGEVAANDGTDVAANDGRVRADPGDGPGAALARSLRDRLAAEGLDEVVATVDEPIERTEETATVAESRVGNLVADALRWRAGADVALSPPGAIRAGPPLAGPVTVAELVGLAPYDDDLTTVALSGDRLREAFVAVPFGYHDDGHPDRHCSHVSGVRLVWDDDAGALLDATVGGEPVDPDRRYTVAVAEYLVESDHVNDAFGPADVVERHGLAREAVVDYARERGLDPSVGGRIERPEL